MGRASELEAVGGFLDAVLDGPTTLVFEGEAGIGKTTLWTATLDQARRRGLRVLSCRATATEIQLGLTGLADLLHGIEDGIVASLPIVQQRALAAALLADDGSGGQPDPRPLAAGFLSVVATLAKDGPVIVAIDDLQWLDVSSYQLVAYAARRWAGPVGLVASRRVPGEGAVRDVATRDPERVSRLRVTPLTLAAVHELLVDRTGRSLTRPPLVRLNSVAHGNPFYALELARTVGPTSGHGEMSLPESLEELVSVRLGRLDPAAHEVLVAASALPVATVDLVRAAIGRTEVVDLLGPAEEDGLITIAGGVIDFTHPLLARGVYEGAPRPQRRALHRRLSELVQRPEERARHLALAAVEPEPEVLDALDGAAEDARRRGAPAGAAELVEMALALGEQPGRAARMVQAAADHLDGGDLDRAGELLDRAADITGPGTIGARAHLLRGVLDIHQGDYPAAIDRLQRAIIGGEGDLQIVIEAQLQLTFALGGSGRLDQALPVAEMCLADAERLGEPNTLAAALVHTVLIRFLLGHGADTASLGRGLALEARDAPIPHMYRPTLVEGLIHLWTGRLDEAGPCLEQGRRGILERGAESSMTPLGFWMLLSACWRGDLDGADRLAWEASQRARYLGAPGDEAFALTGIAVVAAWRGEEDRARAAAEQALALMNHASMVSFSMWPASALGSLDLSLGRHHGVVDRLVPLAEMATAMGIGEGLITWWTPDLIEALIALGRNDEAEPHIARLEDEARTRPRPWSAAVAGRCRGLDFAAQGDLDGAETALRVALEHHAQVPMPHDHARTQATLGQVLRRQGRRTDARAMLTDALATFERIGTARWADRARREIDRLGLRPGPADALTPSEARTAELVATGLTNKEVASALFVSPKTVEANLSRVYRKLGIRSRAEVGRYVAEHPVAPSGDP
ncbi:LuxR family transcriptional regulator [soil metagenome]